MSERRATKASLLLLVAQGFGIGRVAVAPGTFGSVLGAGWFALLLASGSLWALILGTLLLAFLAVPVCGAGERILGQRDPGCVVLDEVAAMPLCFWSWTMLSFWKNGSMPTLSEMISGGHWLILVGGFLAFRLFDVWKPWPVRQSQELPGGWGVVVDDMLAAVYVNLLSVGCWVAGVIH